MNLDNRPPPNASLFLVGRNSRGNWVVRDQDGLCGGLFAGHAEAVKFALAENGNRPHAVITVPGVLELDIGATPRGGFATPADAPLRRVA